MIPINTFIFFMLFEQTEHRLGQDGIALMSEALKVNTTLTKLHLRCKNPRNLVKDRHSRVLLPWIQ